MLRWHWIRIRANATYTPIPVPCATRSILLEVFEGLHHPSGNDCLSRFVQTRSLAARHFDGTRTLPLSRNEPHRRYLWNRDNVWSFQQRRESNTTWVQMGRKSGDHHHPYRKLSRLGTGREWEETRGGVSITALGPVGGHLVVDRREQWPRGQRQMIDL